jgi:signal transduction histidine kinase/ligand-binding sensor domain-containing protein
MCRYDCRISLPVFALLCVLHTGWAQTVRVFDGESGLPHNRINRIYLDSKGFLWICTDDGLSRFDGHRFVNYTTADGLPHKHVNALLETRAGEYWVATDGGVSLFDPKPRQRRFTTYALTDHGEADYVNALIEEPDGSLLLGTNGGLYGFRARSHPQIFGRIDLGPFPDPSRTMMVNDMARDTNGSLWLATNNGLYHSETNGGWAHFGTESGLSADRWFGAEPAAFVHSFAREGNGRLWVAFKGGFGRLATFPNPGTSVLDFALKDQPGLGREVRALWFGTDGRRWIATESGLKEWVNDPNGGSHFLEHTIQDRFPREAFLSIQEDNAGNLWVGTRRSGLVHLGSSRFQTFGASEGLRLGLDQRLLDAKSGQVFVFDVDSKWPQVYRWEGGGRFTAIRPAVPELLADSRSQMAIEDDKGAWWFSTASGLFRFPTLGGRADLRLLPTCGVDQFFEDYVGDVWISYWPRGEGFARLARWNRQSGLVHDESERLPPDARTGIASFAQDHAGTMWIGLKSAGGRLLRMKEGRFQPLSAKWSGHINKLLVDSKGRLWATSTESGLGLIENPESRDPQLRRYTRAQGLSADEVWCVTEDRLGRIYAGTARGVDRLDPGTGQIVHYTTADGLVRGDIRSALRDHNGDLWFASAQGVSKFKPGEDRAMASLRARITGLRVAGVSVPLSEFGEAEIGPLRVSSHQNAFQIDFSAIDFRSEVLHYQFRLEREGWIKSNRTWQDLGTASTVHLVDLSPGGFSFKVRALAPDGSPGDPASLTFSVLQPFWRTWWFQLVCALAVGGLAYSMHTRRLQQQLAIERVRSNIAMDLHDDIGAGLSRISVIGEALKSRLQEGDDDMRRMLNDIGDSSRRLVADMGDIVWSLDPRHDRIGELANRLRSFGTDVLEMRGVAWRVDAPLEGLHQTVPLEVRRQIYLVFKEGIHNISKHSKARSASLRLWFENGHVCGELTDDGAGTAVANGHGNGIPSMRARVKRLSGSVEIYGVAGQGTSIRVKVPVATKA